MAYSSSAIPSREIFWNLSHPLNAPLMYLAFALALVVLLNGLTARYRLWTSSRVERTRLGDWLDRIKIFFTDVGMQRTVRSDYVAGIFHTAIYSGFLVLTFTTTMVFIDHDLGIKIYQGDFYLLVTFLSDLFGLLFFLGLVKAIHRRYIEQPDKLHIAPLDSVLLGSLLLLIVQGFLLEAFRIYATQDPWAKYSFVGYLVSLGLWPLSYEAVKVMHFILWWAHALTFFLALALLPYSKLLHLITSSINLFLKKLPQEHGRLGYPGDIEKILEQASSGEVQLGVSTVADLTWKQRLDLDACTSCGRCQEACPAYNSGKVLSPKWLILDTRNHMLGLHAKESSADCNPLVRLDKALTGNFLRGNGTERRAQNFMVADAELKIAQSADHLLAGEVMPEDVFWSCTTCRACVAACPVGIEHLDLIIDVRRAATMLRGSLPAEAQTALRAIETRGNPFGPAEGRSAWTEGLNVKVLEPGDSVEVLYWVGCVSGFDKRKQRIARSLATVLNAAKVSWGILGNRECCTGDPARRLGDENLFQTLAKSNISTLNSVTFKTLVTNCPHCFHSLGNEYPAVGSIGNGVRVIHHSVYIQELIEQGRIALRAGVEKEMTYHDPCYLSRYNQITEEPRDILVQLGAKPLREMPRSKENGFCCGAGGGHFFMDLKVGTRVNVIRTDEAAATGAELIATSCPFCMQMMEDGVKLTNREAQVEVKDLAEIVAEQLVSVSSLG